MVNMGKKLKINMVIPITPESLLVPVIATTMESLIEKHITISKNKIGPDHKASLEIKDLNICKQY